MSRFIYNYAVYRNSECHYAECHYANCQGAAYIAACLTFAVYYSSFPPKSLSEELEGNVTEPEGFLGQVFNFKLGCFVTVRILMVYTGMSSSKVENPAVSINEIVPKT